MIRLSEIFCKYLLTRHSNLPLQIRVDNVFLFIKLNKRYIYFPKTVLYKCRIDCKYNFQQKVTIKNTDLVKISMLFKSYEKIVINYNFTLNRKNNRVL